MLEVTYDTTGEPAIAVGRGAPTLAEPCEWVRQKAELMVYQQTRGGEFVLIHGDRGSIEPWRGITGQAEAVKRAPQLPDQHVTRQVVRRSPMPQLPALTTRHNGSTNPTR